MATAKIETGNIRLEVSDDHVAGAVNGAVVLLKECMKTPLMMITAAGNAEQLAISKEVDGLAGSIQVCNTSGLSMTFGVPSRS